MAGHRKKRDQGADAPHHYPHQGAHGQQYPQEPYNQAYGQPYAQANPQPPVQPYEGHHGPGPGYDDHHDDHAGGHHDDGPPPPRLPWKQLLTGIVFRPSPTFWQMRDYPMWVPALTVSFLYGTLAVFGLDNAREDILNTTTASLIPYLLVTGVAMVLGALLLSTVTHNLARQFGGTGLWAPTAGFAMLIMALTDVPRLALAVFLGGGAPLVQVLGWATWVFAGVLFTMMVGRSHDLPWQRALAASSIQLLALLMLVKLGTL
ncbi:hypothetical protein GCM10009716_18090 [Streptomyces sodiiphilus]|uniref:Yip1 domain-containing protein n=1 Tax=Streptomyces sodiiphilus TaxID=226217 RepID=A0ABN2P2J6_9ACTN